MVCKNDRIYRDARHPRHDIDTETTDMRYSSIEWCAKMVEPMTDILNGAQKWQNEDRPIEWYVKTAE